MDLMYTWKSMRFGKFGDLGRIRGLYLSRLISKIFYAVLLAPLQPKQSAFVQLKSLLSRNESNLDRMMSAVNLVGSVIPGTTKALSGWMYKNNRFPWAPVDLELIAFGSGAAVFKINWKDGDMVLRIYRKSLGESFGGLVKMAEYYKTNYQTILSWYGTTWDLVLPMEFLVLQGLPFIGPVAASLQPYVYGEKQDFFADFSDDQLLGLMEANDNVRQQFLFFAKQTIRQWDERKICYDFVGRENLILTKQEENYKLQIVDVGIFKFDTLEHRNSKKITQLEQRMNRLISLYELAGRNVARLMENY